MAKKTFQQFDQINTSGQSVIELEEPTVEIMNIRTDSESGRVLVTMKVTEQGASSPWLLDYSFDESSLPANVRAKVRNLEQDMTAHVEGLFSELANG